jgi:hypothetical protein
MKESRNHVGVDSGAAGEPLSGKGASAATDHTAPLETIQPLGVVARGRRQGAGALDPRDDAIAITHEDGLTALNPPQVVAQTVFQLGNLDGDGGPWTCLHVVINCSHDLAMFQAYSDEKPCVGLEA